MDWVRTANELAYTSLFKSSVFPVNARYNDLNGNVSGSLIDNTSFSSDNGNVINSTPIRTPLILELIF